MRVQQAETGLWDPYTVRAHNASTDSENKIHSDDVARSYGFAGGLVGGVGVFSHMTHPLVARFGRDWLAKGTAACRFSKPAYHGDALTVRTAPAPDAADDRALEVRTCNAEGTELAWLKTALPDPVPAADARWEIPPADHAGPREEVSWERLEIGAPFRGMIWQPTLQDNLDWCAAVSDDLPIYRESEAPPLHPGFILKQANNAFKHEFVLNAWMHVGSRITVHELLTVGQTVEIRTIPEEKWEKKGHQFVRLYVAMIVQGRPAVEVLHEAVFNVAKAA